MNTTQLHEINKACYELLMLRIGASRIAPETRTHSNQGVSMGDKEIRARIAVNHTKSKRV